MNYKYKAKGTAANDQTWEIEGIVEGYGVGQFPNVINAAMNAIFMKLTRGEATYGKPGQGGCKGPYAIVSFLLEQQNGAHDG